MATNEPSAQLRAYLLGGTLFTINGEPIHLPTRAAQAVLVYLLHQTRLVPRERLIDLFFPTSDPKQASANLRATVSRLKKVFGPYLHITRAAIGINAEADVWVDSLHFDEPKTDNEIEAQVALYQGDFLAGFALSGAPEFEQWMVMQQERLRMQALAYLREQVDRQTARADFHAALRSCNKLLVIEPLLESAQYAKLLLLARTGQRSLALRHYAVVQRLFEDELGVPLSAETQALHTRIQNLPDQTPSNLPRQRGPFVGRTQELSQLQQRLSDPNSRLITLLGAGGMGKTRLAAQVAQTLLDTHVGLFLDGLFFVELADIPAENTISTIATAIARAVGLKLHGKRTPPDQLVDYLQTRELLLILDNVEHLLDDDAVPQFLSQLLTNTTDVKLLATSRVRLELYEETVFDVAGLSLPTAADTVGQAESVRLFVANAQRQRADFATTSVELAQIAATCRLVDGIPLAIELAAGATRQQTIAEITASIQASYDALATRFRNVPNRHRSLRAAFDYSWQLLTSDQQDLLASLSVFPATFALDDASAIANTNRRGLQALIDRSLVQQSKSDRAFLHGSVREFSAENLDDPAPLQHAHATHFTQQLVALSESVIDKDGFDQLDREYANLLAAWHWWAAQREHKGIQNLIQPLYEYFNWSGRWVEGILLFEQARAGLTPADAHLEALLAARQGRLHLYTDQIERATQLIERVLPVLETHGEQLEASIGSGLRSRIAIMLGDNATAVTWGERGLRLALSAEDSNAIAATSSVLGSAHKALGNMVEARRYMEMALTHYTENDDQIGAGIQLNNLGNLLKDHERYAEALDYWQRASTIFHAQEFSHGEATALSNVSIALGNLARFAEAEQLQRKAIVIKRKLGNKRSLALSLAILCDALVAQQRFDAAQSVLVEAVAVAQASDASDALMEVMVSSAEFLSVTNKPMVASQLASYLVDTNMLSGLTLRRAKAQLILDPVHQSQQPLDQASALALITKHLNQP